MKSLFSSELSSNEAKHWISAFQSPGLPSPLVLNSGGRKGECTSKSLQIHPLTFSTGSCAPESRPREKVSRASLYASNWSWLMGGTHRKLVGRRRARPKYFPPALCLGNIPTAPNDCHFFYSSHSHSVPVTLLPAALHSPWLLGSGGGNGFPPLPLPGCLSITCSFS